MAPTTQLDKGQIFTSKVNVKVKCHDQVRKSQRCCRDMIYMGDTRRSASYESLVRVHDTRSRG